MNRRKKSFWLNPKVEKRKDWQPRFKDHWYSNECSSRKCMAGNDGIFWLIWFFRYESLWLGKYSNIDDIHSMHRIELVNDRSDRKYRHFHKVISRRMTNYRDIWNRQKEICPIVWQLPLIYLFSDDESSQLGGAITEQVEKWRNEAITAATGHRLINLYRVFRI